MIKINNINMTAQLLLLHSELSQDPAAGNGPFYSAHDCVSGNLDPSVDGLSLWGNFCSLSWEDSKTGSDYTAWV